MEAPHTLLINSEWHNAHNDLLRNIKGISNTMLSKSLRELEDAGLVERFEYLEIPVRVEYALTEKAVRLQPILREFIQWEIGRETETTCGAEAALR